MYIYIHLEAQQSCLHFFLETICYDDACHLKRYATNPIRSTLTATTQRLSTMNFVVDRMHFKGHIDPWCRENCDPDKLEAMKKVLTFILFIQRLQQQLINVHGNMQFQTVPSLGMCELIKSILHC